MPLAASEAAALYRSFTLPGQVPHLTTLYKCLPPVTLLFTSFPLLACVLYLVLWFILVIAVSCSIWTRCRAN